MSNNRYTDEEKGKQYDNTVLTVDSFTYAGIKKSDAEREINQAITVSEAVVQSEQDFSSYEELESYEPY